MKYRLDESLFNAETKAAKRFVWIEAYWLSRHDEQKFYEVYTENYQRINLLSALKDMGNHQINFDPSHRIGANGIHKTL